MSGTLIDTDRLFQALLVDLGVDGVTIGADLGPDSADEIPFISHNSILGQDRNGIGLWTVNLTVTLYLEVSTATFQTVQEVYAGIHSWGESPTAGVMGGVAGVETVEDVQAFTRVGQAIDMVSKTATQYVGSFNLTLRNI